MLLFVTLLSPHQIFRRQASSTGWTRKQILSMVKLRPFLSVCLIVQQAFSPSLRFFWCKGCCVTRWSLRAWLGRGIHLPIGLLPTYLPSYICAWMQQCWINQKFSYTVKDLCNYCMGSLASAPLRCVWWLSVPKKVLVAWAGVALLSHGDDRRRENTFCAGDGGSLNEKNPAGSAAWTWTSRSSLPECVEQHAEVFFGKHLKICANSEKKETAAEGTEPKCIYRRNCFYPTAASWLLEVAGFGLLGPVNPSVLLAFHCIASLALHGK